MSRNGSPAVWASMVFIVDMPLAAFRLPIASRFPLVAYRLPLRSAGASAYNPDRKTGNGPASGKQSAESHRKAESG
jgi:hypothetical protein